MDAQEAIDLGREAIRTSMMIGGPILIISLIVGLAIGMMQAMTQVQDQTVSFVPKLLIVLVAIGVCLPWLSDQMLEFSHDVLSKPLMMAQEKNDTAGVRNVSFVPVAWAGNQPVESIIALPDAQQRTKPTWFDGTVTDENDKSPFQLPHYQDETGAQGNSPIQLPHYRISRKQSDDLEG